MTVKNKLIMLVWLFLLLLTCNSVMAANVDITNFHAGVIAGKTRLVFTVTGKPDYLIFSLSHPDRLVLDVKNARLATKLTRQSFGKTSIKNIRFRLYQGYIRIVMDLKKPVMAKSFILPKGQTYRLVVDLVNVDAMSFSMPKLVALPLPEPKKWHLAKIAPALVVPQTVSAPVMTATKKATRGRDIIIVIDPGHGGKDPGTTGRSGTHEKNVVLRISKYLQQDINSQPGFHAVLTRSGDYFIPLRGRLDIARKDKADMFVAIHADAFPSPDAMGASVFALSARGATSEAARWLAEKENKSELLGGASLPDNDNVLRSVLIDLSQTNTISESLQIGSSVLRELGKVTMLHHARVEQAAFVVLKSPDIPSLLIETGFLSTPRQEQQLRNPHYQQLLANAIMLGIKDYFIRNPPQGTTLAVQRFGGRRYSAN